MNTAITLRPSVNESLDNLVHDIQLWQDIQSANISIVTDTFARRIVRTYPEYDGMANALEHECKRFLYLATIAPNFELAPTKPIDEYWHMFILFTEEYEQFCAQYTDRFVHHKPLGAEKHAEVFERTQRIVTTLFGDFPNRELWFLPMPATSCCSAAVPVPAV